MALTVGCPRCPTPVAKVGHVWSCPDHGVVDPLWRPEEASYDAFVEHLGATARFPTYLPWPLSPGWRVTDFAAVGTTGRGRAAMTCVSGTSALDGPVDVLVVAEEPGTGLGARIAGTVHDDPGAEVGEGPPSVRIRIDSQAVPLWPVSTSGDSARRSSSSRSEDQLLRGERPPAAMVRHTCVGRTPFPPTQT
jgi:hypothetical protein